MIKELERLIAVIDLKLASVGDRGELEYHRLSSEGRRIMGEVCTEEGAKFRSGVAGGYSLRLGGLNTSCTSGHFGLLTNWQAAARRRIAILKGKGA